MNASVNSTALVGVKPTPVRVEAQVTRSDKRMITLVGLPDTAVREAKERVLAAMRSSGYTPPNSRITVNLSPADLPKAGSAYDLPIALVLLAASREVPHEAQHVVALGELALDGSVRSARGGLGAALTARELGIPCLLPPSSAAEAAVVRGCDIRVVESLAGAVGAALGMPTPTPEISPEGSRGHPEVDLADVKGQTIARRALEVAAAGGHHLLMEGPPGAGKTLLARCLPGILPLLTESESLEVAQIWSAAGLRRQTFTIRPFRAPHHTATVPALVGGGSGMPSPGEVTLAHHGVLFLDELGEFPPRLLEALRQPIEDGVVTIARRGVSVEFPSEFQLIAATNPCPCGFFEDGQSICECRPAALARYQSRFSGPLLDRFDLRIDVRRLPVNDLTGDRGEPSDHVAKRVAAAREAQIARGRLNRSLAPAELEAEPMSSTALSLLERSAARSSLTARGWDRVRRVARTVADLDDAAEIKEDHMAEALSLRGKR